MPRKNLTRPKLPPSPGNPTCGEQGRIGEGRGEGLPTPKKKSLTLSLSRNSGRENKKNRTICFVTGTRAEFGLMESTLRAIQKRSRLQIVATGMHLSPRHGKSLDAMRQAGWKIDAVVPWKISEPTNISIPSNRRRHFSAAVTQAESTGTAIAHLSRTFSKLKPDIVLVVGDRVEAFAAASAAHLSGIIVAHIHGGDRALGQVDDSLRHAITKLAHIHFPATRQSAERIKKLGEQPWRIHRVGSPGIDGIVETAQTIPRWPGEPFALIVLHPADPDEKQEFLRADMVYRVARAGLEKLIVIYPNNDPGSSGILRCWKSHANDPKATFFPNVPRAVFLALLRDAAVLIGNSSSGIIEAASFGTPVIDIGPRQQGRDHGENVIHVEYSPIGIHSAIKKLYRSAQPSHRSRKNIYGNGRTAQKIAAALAEISLTEKLGRKLIAY